MINPTTQPSKRILSKPLSPVRRRNGTYTATESILQRNEYQSAQIKKRRLLHEDEQRRKGQRLLGISAATSPISIVAYRRRHHYHHYLPCRLFIFAILFATLVIEAKEETAHIPTTISTTTATTAHIRQQQQKQKQQQLQLQNRHHIYDTTSCRDHEGTITVNEEKYTCWNARKDQSLCTIFPKYFQNMCPYSCNSCCRDNPNKFESIYPDFDVGKPKKCSMIADMKALQGQEYESGELPSRYMDLCRISKKWRNECPVSCGICPCSDTVGKFIRDDMNTLNGENKSNTDGISKRISSCYIAQMKQPRCRWEIYKEKCPLTCNTCPQLQIFEPICDINAKVSFPNIEDAPYYGYHSDNVRVEKIGETSKNSVCGFENTNTSWGCEHSGVARIFHNKKDYSYHNRVEAEYVHIKNVKGSSFIFYLSHYFNVLNEDYYDKDHRMFGTMIIVPSRGKKRKFHHPKNKNIPTHKKDGSINPNYNGEVKVRVDCNGDCICEMNKIV